MSITFDAKTTVGQPDAPAASPGLLLRIAAAGCLGFAAGYGVANFRPMAASPADTPLALAAYAVSEANLARAAADMAVEIERLVDSERDYARFRGSRAEADALMRSGLALSAALRAGGSYAPALAGLRALDGGEQAIGPLLPALLQDIDGVPDRPGLAAQLEAIAASLLALGEEEPQRWTTRMAQRLGALVGGDSRVAIQARRTETFAAARDAAARGALPEAIAALEQLDVDAAIVLSGWVESCRQRIALDAMADRVAAMIAAYSYR